MDELKKGSRHSADDQKMIQDIHDKALALGAVSPETEPRAGWALVKSELAEPTPDTLITFGAEVKALGDGRVGGYLVRFTSVNDPDLAGEYFDASTDFGEPSKLPVLYHHGLDAKVGRRRIGTAEIQRDDVGLWAEAQLNLRDEYEKMIYALAEKNKLGWSSGAAAHTVARADSGSAKHITQWYIAEASLTPTPAEYRNTVTAVKNIQATDLLSELPEATPEDGNVGDAATAAGTDSPKISKEAATAASEGIKMGLSLDERQELIDEMKKVTADAVKAMAPDLTKAAAEAALTAMNAAKNAPPTTPPGGLKTDGAPAFNKTPRGDDAFKAFSHFIKTGDAGGIRTGEAYDAYMKTDYHLVEGTQYQGQEAVPTEVYAGIVKKRNTLSFARMGGAQVYQAGSNALNIPVEKAQPQNWGITAADAATASTTLTQQPLDKLAATLYVFTYNLPYHYTLIDDATFNIEGWGTDYVARGLARTENNYFTMGTGSGQPQGAVYASTAGTTAASATAVTAQEVAALYYKLDAAYQDNVVWAMLAATHGAVRALAGPSNGFAFIGNGGYNGGAGMGSAEPNAGWLVDPRSRVFTPNGMDSLAASKKPIFVGNLNAGYAIVERQGLTVLRDPYSEASLGNVNVWFRARFTGGVTNADALYHLPTPSA